MTGLTELCGGGGSSDAIQCVNFGPEAEAILHYPCQSVKLLTPSIVCLDMRVRDLSVENENVLNGEMHCWSWATVSVRSQPPRPTQPSHPSVSRRKEYDSRYSISTVGLASSWPCVIDKMV